MIKYHEMIFKQLKIPKKPPAMQTFLALIALSYRNLLSTGGALSGGFIYTFVRPILFSLLLAVIFRAFRRGLDLIDAFAFFYLPVVFFFYIFQFFSRANSLNLTENLMNFPFMSHLIVQLSIISVNIVLLIPQILFSIFLFYLLGFGLNFFDIFNFFLLSTFFSASYYLVVSLLLFKNFVLVEIHNFLSRGLLFISAVFFQVSSLPDAFRPYLTFNPIANIMEYIRSVTIGGDDHYYSIEYIIVISIVLLLVFPFLYFIRIFVFHFNRPLK